MTRTAPTAPAATPIPPTPDPPGARAALARCVGDVDRFLADVAAVGAHRHRSDSFDDLLSLDDVDSALTERGLRHPAVRLVRDGEAVPHRSWTKRTRTGATWIDDLVDPPKLLDLHAAGATVVLQSLQRWWPPLGSFCRDLETALGHPVQANAYLTPPGAAGLLPHHDTHDVFVLQVHGTKSWVIRQPRLVAPLPHHRSTAEEAGAQPVLFEADLAPGDCLYLPRGFVHSAQAQAGTSLHLTVGILATTGHDIVRTLVERAAAEVPALRRDVPAIGASEIEPGDVKAIITELIAWLEQVDPASFVERGARTAATTGVATRGRLLDLAGLESLDDDTTVVARVEPGAIRTAPTAVSGDELRLALADRELVLPVALSSAIALLLDGAPHRVGELAALLDEPSRHVLVRRLVREGALGLDRAAEAPGG